MKYWQSLTLSVLAHAVLLSIPMTAVLQMQERSEVVRFVMVAGSTTAGGRSGTIARTRTPRGAASKEISPRPQPVAAASAKVHSAPRQVPPVPPDVRSDPSPVPSVPSAVRSASLAARPSPSKVQPVSRPKTTIRTKRRAEFHHVGRSHRPTARVRAQRKVTGRKVLRPPTSRKAQPHAGSVHANQNPLGRSAPAATASSKRAQSATTGGTRSGGAARGAASPAALQRGPVMAQWGAADGPHFVHRVMPCYPRLARRLGKQGVVLLQVTIDQRGRPTQVKVVHGGGFGFDEQARRAVRDSLFSPARRNGRPVVCKVLLPVRFVLRSSS